MLFGYVRARRSSSAQASDGKAHFPAALLQHDRFVVGRVADHFFRLRDRLLPSPRLARFAHALGVLLHARSQGSAEFQDHRHGLRARSCSAGASIIFPPSGRRNPTTSRWRCCCGFLLTVFARQMFTSLRDDAPLRTMAYTLFGLLYVLWLLISSPRSFTSCRARRTARSWGSSTCSISSRSRSSATWARISPGA